MAKAITAKQEVYDARGTRLEPVTVSVPDGHVLVRLHAHVGEKHLPGAGVTLGPGDLWHLPEAMARESPLFEIVDAAEHETLPQERGAFVSGALQREDPVTGLLPEDLAADPFQTHEALPEEDA